MSIPAGGIPQYDQLYVISDLHLGGTTGFQIFNAGKEAELLIQRLRTSSPEKRIALVINGDLVDFLAERPARHFDPAGAVDKLDRIVGDPSFAPVWKALQKFAATKNRWLIINLGNHDLELALPWVRAHLLEILSGGNESACARIVLTFDGTGFLCQVGNAKILCVHGNEVDDWNVTDHEKIRRLGRDLVQGRQVESWIPNAGTQLVIDIMNNLKSSYPFVDLLKPELQAVVPTLLALAPDQRDKIGAIAATARRLAWDMVRRATGLLGATEEQTATEEPETFQEGPFSAAGSRHYADELLREAEDRMRRDVDPMSLVAADQRGGYLGGMGALRNFFRGESPSEILREALEKLAQNRSFDLNVEDDTSKRLDERMGDVDFLVAGHTHLERALRRRYGSGWYFNTGTWVRLIRLKPEVLKSKEKFGQIYNVFKSGKMADLDVFPGLVLRHLTAGVFWTDAAGTHGQLQRVGQSEPILSEVKDSLFTKS
jgi:UDP-2,3-diacylglucosamine pyrophosphatase LpxH